MRAGRRGAAHPLTVPLVLSGSLLLVPMLALAAANPSDKAQVVTAAQVPSGTSDGDAPALDDTGVPGGSADAGPGPDEAALPVYADPTGAQVDQGAGGEPPGEPGGEADPSSGREASAGRGNESAAPATTAGRSRTVSVEAKKPAPRVAVQSGPPAAAREPAPPKSRPAPARSPGRSESGTASWYDYKAGTCAHKTLSFGTIVNVVNTNSGQSTRCRVADRGPFVSGRIIDLERGVFDDIAPPGAGVIPVRITW